jgi:hypothetical protein
MINFTLDPKGQKYTVQPDNLKTLSMYSGSNYCGYLNFEASGNTIDPIFINSMKIEKRFQHTVLHYGSILLDYALNRMFVNLSQIHKTIQLEARPFHISEYHILTRYPEAVDIPELLKYFYVTDVSEITKDMLSYFASDRTMFNYALAEDLGTNDLVNFYKRFGFKEAGKGQHKSVIMKRPNKVIPVPDLVKYTTGKLKLV